MRRLITLVCFCLSLVVLSAKEVSGVVVDSSGNPVADATVFWLNTNDATLTDEAGQFAIPRVRSTDRLVITAFGYVNDTIPTKGLDRLQAILYSGVELREVEVRKRMTYSKLRSDMLNTDMISTAELARAACCNLGESFTTNPSVDVSYSDAATGARQIKLLGLSGTYVQMLTENVPNYRGPAAPYSLGYIPGPWMQSIQVSKGASSVKNGYESITGQINVEFKKPQTDNEINANLYANSRYRLEANFDGNVHITPRLSTSLLAHYENTLKGHDGNNDGFLDMPRVEQYNFRNRWAWMGDNYVFQASVNALKENRRSGQDPKHHSADLPPIDNIYRINVATDRYEAFLKNAYIFDKEKSTNLALILSGNIHNQDSYYGHKFYDIRSRNAYASLMFESTFDSHNSLSAGLSYNYDYYKENYRLVNDILLPSTLARDHESVVGLYAQYTYNLNDRLILMGGLREDHSSIYGFFFTPRAHIKFIPDDRLQLRASIGKGYRSSRHILAENNYLLASGRRIVIEPDLQQEEALNTGLSLTYDLPLLSRKVSLSAEYYYTRFIHQTVIDLDSDPHTVLFYNLRGRSFSHTFQIEATAELFRGFTLTAAYRHNMAKTTYGDRLLQRPLTGADKGLFSASYETPLGLWQFDATLQLNGGGRMPTPYTLPDGTLSWPERYKGFPQLSAQVTRHFRHFSIYLGGENLTNFKQRNPIINADNPWDDNFDSTMIWGPVEGLTIYIGARFNLKY